jgi:hypothetical protein
LQSRPVSAGGPSLAWFWRYAVSPTVPPSEDARQRADAIRAGRQVHHRHPPRRTLQGTAAKDGQPVGRQSASPSARRTDRTRAFSGFLNKSPAQFLKYSPVAQQQPPTQPLTPPLFGRRPVGRTSRGSSSEAGNSLLSILPDIGLHQGSVDLQFVRPGARRLRHSLRTGASMRTLGDAALSHFRETFCHGDLNRDQSHESPRRTVSARSR